MNTEVKSARINALAVIVAAIIGGLFAIVPTIIGNDKLKKDYEELQSENLELTAQQDALKENYERSQTAYDTLNKNYIYLQNKFEALEKDYDILLDDDSDKGTESLAENDELEVAEILETMSYYLNDDNINGGFENLSQDASELELFYKIYISIGYYKYSNIIIAFDEYGIDCKSMLITEKTLELWDMENIYLYCNILENVENSEEKEYLFKDYKIDAIDQCDYRGYGFRYQDETYDMISDDISKRLESFIRKVKRNIPLLQ